MRTDGYFRCLSSQHCKAGLYSTSKVRPEWVCLEKERHLIACVNTFAFCEWLKRLYWNMFTFRLLPLPFYILAIAGSGVCMTALYPLVLYSSRLHIGPLVLLCPCSCHNTNTTVEKRINTTDKTVSKYLCFVLVHLDLYGLPFVVRLCNT